MAVRKLAIDLGTVNTTIQTLDAEMVLKEPTVVASSLNDGGVLAIGSHAQEMLGKTPEDILAVRPLSGGVIADYDTACLLLKHFLNIVIGKSRLFKPEVLASVPLGATSVEARAVVDAFLDAGAKKVSLVPQALAASIGAGLPVAEPSGNMIVNIGGGVTDIAVVSLYGMVSQGSIRLGGRDLDVCISQHIRRKYGLVIGDTTAELVKVGLASAIELHENRSIEVKGRDSVTGFPKIINVSSSEICQAISQILEQIAMCIKNVLEKTPPELSSDIMDKGIVLSGGTALLRNLAKYLSEYIGVPVHTADDPLYCVIRGLSFALKDVNPFNKSLVKV